MMPKPGYRWAQWGDLNAFFGLMLDNITTLLVMTGILVGVFGYPACERIQPDDPRHRAWRALWRSSLYLAGLPSRPKDRKNRMSLPCRWDSILLRPSALRQLSWSCIPGDKGPVVTWQVGMATLMIIGIFKVILSFSGEWVRRRIPQAGLLVLLQALESRCSSFFQ